MRVKLGPAPVSVAASSFNLNLIAEPLPPYCGFRLGVCLLVKLRQLQEQAYLCCAREAQWEAIDFRP